MRVTQLRIFSSILMFIASICMILCLSTTHWYNVNVHSKSIVLKYHYGLFKFCVDGNCQPTQSQAWLTAIISCIVIAVTISIITLFGFILVFFMKKSAKIVAVGMFLAAIFAAISLLLYPLKNQVSSKGSMGYSYYLGWVSMATAVGAGVFAISEREERIQPTFYAA